MAVFARRSRCEVWSGPALGAGGPRFVTSCSVSGILLDRHKATFFPECRSIAPQGFFLAFGALALLGDNGRFWKGRLHLCPLSAWGRVPWLMPRALMSHRAPRRGVFQGVAGMMGAEGEERQVRVHGEGATGRRGPRRLEEPGVDCCYLEVQQDGDCRMPFPFGYGWSLVTLDRVGWWGRGAAQ